MAQKRISLYSAFRPTGADPSIARELEALAGVSQQVGNIAFGVAAKKRQEQGALEGAKAGREAAETGGELDTTASPFSIYDEAYNNAQATAYIAGVDRDAAEEITVLKEKHKNDLQAFDASASAYRNGLLEGVPESIREQLYESVDGYISRGRAQVRTNVIEEGRRRADSELIGAVDGYARDSSAAARNGEDEAAELLVKKAKLAANGLVLSGRLTQEEADEQIRVIGNEVIEQKYLRKVDDLPVEEAVAYIEEAAKFVPEGFSGDEWDRLIARAKVRLAEREAEDRKQNAIDKSAFRQEAAAVEIAIKTGEGDPDEILTRLSRLFDVGHYEPTKYAGLVGTVYNDLKKTQKVWERVGGDESVVVDPVAVDKVYRKDIADQDEATKAQFAIAVNQVPGQMKDEITTKLYANDLELAAGAADMIMRLDDVQGLPDPFSAKDRAYAEQIKALSPYYSMEEAVKMAKQATDPRDKDRIEFRKQYIKDEYKPGDFADKAESALGPYFGSLDPMTAPLVTNEYKKLFESHFLAGMDEDQAHKTAKKLMEKNFSEWNGRMMKHSPDKYYSIGGNADWIDSDLRTTLSDSIAGAPEIKDYYLISDDRTEREASQGMPSYLVRYRTENGWDLLMGRYVPDVEKGKAGVFKESEEAIAKERQKSRRKKSQTYIRMN